MNRTSACGRGTATPAQMIQPSRYRLTLCSPSIRFCARYRAGRSFSPETDASGVEPLDDDRRQRYKYHFRALSERGACPQGRLLVLVSDV